MDELRSRGRFDTANRHPEALQKIEQGVGIRFESLTQAGDAIRIQRQLADKNFNGDACAAIDFIIQQGRNPELARLPFTLQNLQSGLLVSPRVTSASTANERPNVDDLEPSVTIPTTRPLEDCVKIPEQSNAINRFQFQRDQFGRLDLNCDGVGGLQGLIKAISDKVGGFTMAGNGNLSNPSEMSRVGDPKWQPDMTGRPMAGKPYDPYINTLN